MTIHTIITEQTDLARTYTQDGAFRSAARVLRDLATKLIEHADWCDGDVTVALPECGRNAVPHSRSGNHAMTKDQFEAALAAANIPSWREPRVERDGEFAYDCFDNDDGDEIGFVSYRDGEVIGYTIHDR